MKHYLRHKCSLMFLFMTFISLVLLCLQVQASTNNANPLVELSDNGTLTINAEAVTLETLLKKIVEQSGVTVEIPEKLLRQPISVSFKSLPLDKAIRRVLRGVSYSCIFDSNGNMLKVEVVDFPKSIEDKDNHVDRSDARLDFPHEPAMAITSPPEPENIMEAMEGMPSPELQVPDEAVKTAPSPEVVNSLVESIKDAGGSPPPELVRLMEANEVMPTTQAEDTDAAVETAPLPEVVKDLLGLLKMREGDLRLN